MRRNDWLIRQLPMGMQDDEFFVRFVAIFQDLATTLLDGVDNIPNSVDVDVAPAPLVRWLGSWLGVDNIDSSLPVELQRRIVRESGQIMAWRGTRRGLVQFLELITGGPVVVDDSGGIFAAGEAGHRAPHVRMRVESTGWIREEDFVAVVVDELPANVTFELYVRDRRLWPPPPSSEAHGGVQAGVRVVSSDQETAPIGVNPAVAGSGPTVSEEVRAVPAPPESPAVGVESPPEGAAEAGDAGPGVVRGPIVTGDSPPFAADWTPPESPDGEAP